LSEAAFAALVEDCWPAVEAVNAMGSHGNVTLFELLGAMAFSAFVQEGCHWGVIEVGLGGRLDSTNVVDPAVAVITSISIDHAAILGGTIAEIAKEKAGIIKPGAPVVIGPQPPEALEVFRKVAQERGSPLTYVPDDYTWERTSSDIDGQAFSVTGPSGTRNLWIPLLGFHQIENATVAFAVLELLEKRNSNATSSAGKIKLASEELANGLSKVQWPARMEVLSKSPVLMADGAHNAASLRRLHESLREYVSFEDLILVVGWGTDKESEEMALVVAEMAPKSVVVGKSRHPRSMTADSLAELLRRSGVPVTDACSNIAEAVRKAMSLAGPNDLVLATGSLFVAAETREEVLGIPSEVYPEFNAAAAPAI
jgi:dihydrofolate synthase/folylpolyglutamate synthase